MIPKSMHVVKLLQSANGSSQPWFSLLDDGEEWLVKFAGAGPGPDALLAEYIANHLGRHWGLPIAETTLVWLDEAVEKAGTDEFWDVLAKSRGHNLAIKRVPHADNVVPDLQLPKESLSLLCAFDRLLANWDRTVLSRNLLRDLSGTLWWIDHGSCRFLHALRGGSRPSLPSNHFLAGADPSLLGEPAFSCPELSLVEEIVNSAPAEWVTAHKLSKVELSTELHRYLHVALSPP